MIRLAMLLVLALAGCQPEPKPLDSGLAGYDPKLIEREKAACVERGGRWGGGGKAAGMVCYETTPDGGKSCSAESDCAGLCLARSRSCSPVTPVFGCNAVLTGNGTEATICID